jgi:Ni,Fe-hydrogenase maturation factor
MISKIICLGNEFILGDSLAKRVGELLNDFEVVNVRDSFQLMTLLKETEDPVVLDVVQRLKEPRLIRVDELRNDSILSAHDFDAGYAIKLVGKDVKIIGIPTQGDVLAVKEKVLGLLGLI